MNETDIYISAHDAGLLNLVFMQPHSAVIEVLDNLVSCSLSLLLM